MNLVRRGKTIVMVTHDPSLTSRTSRTIIIADGELIDETVVKALPLLRHRHMLEMTKDATRITVQPGEVILDCNQPVDNLYMIASGSVNVMQAGGKHGKLLAHLKAGNYSARSSCCAAVKRSLACVPELIRLIC